MISPVFRFAPSPNGNLHLGHALSALINADMARAAGGRLLLRIEDIDATRCRPVFETAIYEDLAWLGIAWETPVRRQSEHFSAYASALEKLDQQGLLYPSFESRADIARMVAARDESGNESWPRDPDGAPLYPGLASEMPHEERVRRMARGEPYALRLDMQRAIARAGALSFVETGAPAGPPATIVATPEAWGDVVLARKETPTSYHLSVVIDDALQGITHVVRGQDLYAATGLHRLLQRLLDLPAPTYGHHRLVLDADGKKLAKSTGATALRSLRQKGVNPAGIRRLVRRI
jgi:glutamyl-Q tRNA(Asp) synthetase